MLRVGAFATAAGMRMGVKDIDQYYCEVNGGGFGRVLAVFTQRVSREGREETDEVAGVVAREDVRPTNESRRSNSKK